MFKAILLFSSLVLFFSTFSFAQTDADIEKRLQEMLQMRRKMMEKFFNDDFNSFFGQNPFQGFDSKWSQHMQSRSHLEHGEVEGDAEKLIVILPSSENTKLDISVDTKIGQIKINSESTEIVETNGSRSHSTSVYNTFLSIPTDVVVEKYKTLNIDGKVILCFPKVGEKKACQDKQVTKLASSFKYEKPVVQNSKLKNRRRSLRGLEEKSTKRPKKKRFLKPLAPEKGDISI